MLGYWSGQREQELRCHVTVNARMYLEYCVQLWLSCYRQDVSKLQRLWKYFTSILPGLEGLSYKQSLDRLGLFSLEQRKLRCNLIEDYEHIRGLDKVKSHSLFFPG